MISIGGIGIDKVEIDGTDVSAVLYMDGDPAIEIMRSADGFYDYEILNGTNTETHFLYRMHNLFEIMGSVRDTGSKSELFIQSPSDAIKGYLELLLDVKKFAETYESVPSHETIDTFIVVMQLGSSWFKLEDGKPKTFVYRLALTDTYATATKSLKNFAEIDKPKYGDVMAAAILRGKMKWELSNEDYRSLYNPFE